MAYLVVVLLVTLEVTVLIYIDPAPLYFYCHNDVFKHWVHISRFIIILCTWLLNHTGKRRNANQKYSNATLYPYLPKYLLDASYFFIWLQVTISKTFTSCRTAILAVNSLSFCVPENVFTAPLFSKFGLSHRILG